MESANAKMRTARRAEVGCDEKQATGPLAGRIAVVTGASSGVGRAIALALARHGAQILAVGRNSAALAETVAAVQPSSSVTAFQIDLNSDENLEPLVRHLTDVGRLDVLIHCAGVIRQGLMEQANIEDLDLQYVTNVRAPYLLTKRLLPLLTTSRGQIVFVNSSAGLTARGPEVGQYAATKHALRAIADSLREELNPKGIRVLSVYLGRTATPMQEALFREEGKTYHPEILLQPEDVAAVVVQTLMLPATAEVTDISIRPMRKLPQLP
jgi:NAD(P)-dependent dehydrogenase (short-subunit alcohol dehydrogenase family)